MIGLILLINVQIIKCYLLTIFREFGISKSDYFGGCFLLAFDRTPDKCNRFHRHIMESGNIDVNLKTGTALNETALVIIYGTYSTDLVIDGDTVTKFMF